MTRRLLLFIAPVVVFLTAFDWPSVFQRTAHFVFQNRDMARAFELLNGTPIFFGPEMTGGGHLPGPLYYFLLAPPLALHPTWVAAWYMMMVLTGAGLVFGWSFMRARCDAASAAVWLILILSSPIILRNLLSFLNISFVLPFAVAAFALLYWALVAERASDRRRSYFYGALLTGLAVQLHFSAIAFLAGFWLAQPFAPWLRARRLSLKDLAIGLACFLIPLLPYFAFLTGGSKWGQMPFYAGEAMNALPSLWLLVQTAASEFPPDKLLNSFMQKVVETVSWPLLPIGLAFWLVPKTGRLRSLLFLTLIAFVPFFYWTFATIGIRYAVVFNIAMTFLTAHLFFLLSRSPRRLEVFVYCAALILLLAVFYYGLYVEEPIIDRDYVRIFLTVGSVLLAFGLAAGRTWSQERWLMAAIAVAAGLALMQGEFGRARHFYPEPRLMPRSSRWAEVWRYVIPTTGWSYEEAMSRMYFVNQHLERDGFMTFSAVARRVKPRAAVSAPPDGFFVVIDETVNFETFKLVDIKNWLLLQNIPTEIKEALKAGHLRLSERYASDFLLVPYHIEGRGPFTRSFHNNGQGYLSSESDRLLENVTEREGVRILPDGRLIFKWNECESRHSYCSTGAIVKVEPGSSGRRAVSVQIAGSSISQSSPWISPSWTQAWIKPYMEVRCRGVNHRFPLAESVGYLRKYSALPNHVLLWGNNSILAPFAQRFEFPCTADPSQITVGREGSEVERLHDVLKLPGARLSIHL